MCLIYDYITAIHIIMSKISQLILLLSLLLGACVQKEKKEVIRVTYEEQYPIDTLSFNIVGKWRLDSTYLVDKGVRAKVSYPFSDTQWHFSKDGEYTSKIAEQVFTIEGQGDELKSDTNQYKGTYTVQGKKQLTISTALGKKEHEVIASKNNLLQMQFKVYEGLLMEVYLTKLKKKVD